MQQTLWVAVKKYQAVDAISDSGLIILIIENGIIIGMLKSNID